MKKNMLKKLGMEREFIHWKHNIYDKVNYQIGSQVRIKKDMYGLLKGDIGTIKEHGQFVRGKQLMLISVPSKTAINIPNYDTAWLYKEEDFEAI